MSLIKTEAIVIKVSDYSESTRLVTLLTPDLGRIRVLAKGIRRLKSRDRGLLEPFTRAQVTLYLKEPGALGTLRESSPLRSVTALREDFDRWLLASLVLEVIDREMQPGEAVEELYARVCDYLEALETTDRPGETTAATLTAMLGWFGFAPQFRQCGLCGSAGPFVGFRIDRSCVVCEGCSGEREGFRPLPPGTLKALEHLAAARGHAALRLSAGQIEQVFGLLIALLQYHLDVQLVTARMLTSETLGKGAGHTGAPAAKGPSA